MQTAKMTQYDKMTKTPVSRLILVLSIPTILSMLITTIYNLVDTAFVGQLGTSASGAVGIVFSFMAVLQSIGFLFGQGGGSILSRQLGAKDKEAASRTASTAFFCAFGLALLLAIVCLIFLDRLVILLGSTETIAPYAKDYIFYILLAAPFVVTSFSLNNFLRYEGKAKLGTVGMMTGAILNMVGDPILMFYCDLGIAGAGMSTAISQLVSFLILLYMVKSGRSEIDLKFRHFSGSLRHIGDIIGTGLPSLLRQLLASLSTIVLNTFAGPYGDAAIAALGIVSRVSFAGFSVSLGIGQAFQPISAFNFGAKKFSRVREAYKKALIYSEIVMIVIAIFEFIFAEPIVTIFRDDPEVIKIGIRALRIYVVAQSTMPLCSMVEMLLQTTGHKLSSSLLSSSRSGLILIPCIIVLSYIRGLEGLEEAQPLALVLSCIPAIFLARDFFKKLPKEEELT